jgi:hypothetical protein
MATDFDGILDSIMSSIIDDRMDRESDSEPAGHGLTQACRVYSKREDQSTRI